MQQSVFDLARKDGVSTDAYAYGAILASVVFNEGVYEFRIRRDKAIKKTLYRAQSVCLLRLQYCGHCNEYEVSQFFDTREALLTSVRVTIYRQISTTGNALYVVLTVSTQIAITTQSTWSSQCRHR